MSDVFMSSFGLTSAAAIAVSLLVSFTLTPMLAARWIKQKNEGRRMKDEENSSSDLDISDDGQNPKSQIPNPKSHDSKNSWFYSKIDGSYTWLLKLSMRFRWVIVLLCVIAVASIYPLYKYVGMAFLPEEDESLYQVNLRGPQGTSLSATQSILDRIARDIREQVPGVENTLVLAGFGRGSGPNNGFINIRLKPVDEREKSQAAIINQTRGLVKKYQSKDYQVSVSATSSIAGSIGLGGRGGGSTGIGFYIAGPDIKMLNTYATQLVDRLKQDPSFRDPDTSIEVGTPEIRVVIDRTKAADLGVKAGDIAQALNILAAGQRISTFNEGSDQYDVIVQADEQFRRDRNNLQYFTVASSNGVPVSLEKTVKLAEGLSPSSINRLNRQRQVSISSSLPPNASESDALAKLVNYAKDLNMPPEYVTGVTGQSKELNRAYDSFMLAFLLSFIFMYLILAAQFESFIHPITILLTLPLSIPFALISTAIAGQTLNIFSALGILLLFGIVKKNAILQIDHTNTLRSYGMNRYDAIIQANRDRLRPILMTTLALVAGMIPLTLGSGAGAATNRSIGILVVGGQSLCLLLTLLAVPVFYSIFEDIQELKIFKGIGGAFSRLRRKKEQTAKEDLETIEDDKREGLVFMRYYLFKNFIKILNLSVLGLCFTLISAAQNPTPTPTPKPTPNKVDTSKVVPPAELPNEPPPVAPNFSAPVRPLPSAERIGVDAANQLPLTLDEAIEMALRNNNDIDNSRINVRIAEENLKGARGVYDPQLSSESFYESRTTPTASTIGGAGSSGGVTQTATGASASAEGFSPKAGGTYSASISSSKTTTDNQNATLNPQYPAAVTLTYTQPLWRGLKIDNNRRQIEIAKKISV
ncbi:MAG: TolC family protein [Blastocatellia bacterium]|nr:TolC family protein [Blastocatellia bacterium]